MADCSEHLEINSGPLLCNSAAPNLLGVEVCAYSMRISRQNFQKGREAAAKYRSPSLKDFFTNIKDKFFEKGKLKDNFLISMCIYKTLSMPARS